MANFGSWPKKFVQRYNAKVKHKGNLNELKVTEDLILRHKIRRVNNDDKNEKLEESSEKQEEDEITAESKPKL